MYQSGYIIAIAFVLLEQATSTTTFITTAIDTTITTTVVTATGSIYNMPVTMVSKTTSSNSKKVSQKRNSAEHISLDPFTKDVPSAIPHIPTQKPKKFRPIDNRENKETSFSVPSDSTSSAAGNTDNVNTCQNICEENLSLPHIPPASQQFVMHSEESTNLAGSFQSNIYVQ